MKLCFYLSQFNKGEQIMNNKSLFQKIYSALGFWKYRENTDSGTYDVFYWYCFPYGKFFRKFDLFRVKV